MNKKKKLMTLVICLSAAVLLLPGCGRQEPETADGGILMEKSTAEWTKVLEENCGVSGIGRPQGTARESWQLCGNTYIVTFKIDREMTQTLTDGYAQSLWRACEKAAAGSNQSSSGYRYSDMREAVKMQEPLNYYIWYYTVGKQKYRLGLYSTNMETGMPGGLILKIEPWKQAL